MARKTTVVHVTHEAVGKVGGIGAVLDGFFTCNSYLDAVDRSILVGPLFTTEAPPEKRLGEDGTVLYSSIDGIAQTSYAPLLSEIERHFNAPIVYGRVAFSDHGGGVESSQEALLVDVRNTAPGPVNELKRRLYEEFGICSDLYEHLWEYEQYVRAAPVAIEALKVIGAATDGTIVIAHEFMGMPTALAAILEPSCDFKTAFYAHEVATMRRIAEGYPGHDTMFCNVLRRAAAERVYVTELFGRQDSFFKHSLVEASRYCDGIFAVGRNIADELRFLAPEFETAEIDVVYNGIPAYQISVADRLGSKGKLQQYCENLLGFRPDFVFTHVTRLIVSKGLWRDLEVLCKLEERFRADGKTAVFFLLSTQVSQRPKRDIENMESAYGWPVAHREGWPDMSGGESDFYTAIQQFNAGSRNIKIVFINQFFKRDNCGRKMPPGLDFMDFRRGTDVEFGQSIYEPFGISQLEPLTFGGICVVSNVCGCAGFLQDVTGGQPVDNVIVADYTQLSDAEFKNIEDLLQIDRQLRNRIEATEAARVASEILQRLGGTDAETARMIQSGYSLAKHMSWDLVLQDYLLPGLQKCCKRGQKFCAKA